ncbi:MAG: hypothetical protein EBT64_05165 [Gammaproteobacteria bacterium]|nr:hypothetical protein [Gammaproteobacteria bacterium]
MIRRGWIIGLASSGLVVGLLVWLPASIVRWVLPSSMACESLSGSVWHGRCVGLSVRGSRSGVLTWSIRGVTIDRPGVDVTVQWSKEESVVAGALQLAASGLTTLVLDRGSIDMATLRSALPADILMGPLASVAGRLYTSGLTLEFDGPRIRSLQGDVILRDAILLKSGAPIGPFVARFEGKRGSLSDLGGPLRLSATVLIDPPGAFKAQTRMQTRTSSVLPGVAPGVPIEAEIEGRF